MDVYVIHICNRPFFFSNVFLTLLDKKTHLIFFQIKQTVTTVLFGLNCLSISDVMDM